MKQIIKINIIVLLLFSIGCVAASDDPSQEGQLGQSDIGGFEIINDESVGEASGSNSEGDLQGVIEANPVTEIAQPIIAPSLKNCGETSTLKGTDEAGVIRIPDLNESPGPCTLVFGIPFSLKGGKDASCVVSTDSPTTKRVRAARMEAGNKLIHLEIVRVGNGQLGYETISYQCKAIGQ